MRRILFAAAVALTLMSQGVYAIHLGEGDLPWSQSMTHPLDKPLNDQYDGKCFFMNLGPTGIRARIDPEAPKQFKVMYVFQDAKSPAKGKINIGDMIIGANGKSFKDPHGFHRKQGGRGWPGPPYELALAIEESQGRDGTLELMVLPGGNRSEKSTVSLQLKPVGRFSETYPWNCPRSDKLLEELCDFLFDHGVQGRHHYQIQQLLALWASGDKRAIPLVKAKADELMRRPPEHTSTGMVTWGWGYTGIFLGEYYNQFKDKGVVQTAEALAECYELGQDWQSGGYSHRPFPAIEQRVAAGGPKGYGSMAAPGGLAMLAQSIFKATGLPYSERAYERTHQAYLLTAGGNARADIAYGFKAWPHAVLNLSDNRQARSKEGVGYLVPAGMNGIGAYTIGWPTKDDPRWTPTDWVKREASENSLFEQKDYRIAVRTMTLPEPSKPYQTSPGGGGHIAPVGMGAVAHFIGNTERASWGYLGKHMATCCANSAKTLWDGHACSEMHAFFGVLGAARADEKSFREFLDYTKTWIILSETHDGQGLVEQPFGCQRNSTCTIARDRTTYTHVAILLLSIPKRKLLITGADYAEPAVETTVKRSPDGSSLARLAPVPVARKARTLSADRLASLDRSLQRTLTKLSEAGALQPFPLKLSVTSAQVQLSEVKGDGTLIFQLVGGSKTAAFQWSRLARKDHATLALLVAACKPDSADVQAMAGVYMEAMGQVGEADKYFAKAGEDSTRKLAALFD